MAIAITKKAIAARLRVIASSPSTGTWTCSELQELTRLIQIDVDREGRKPTPGGRADIQNRRTRWGL